MKKAYSLLGINAFTFQNRRDVNHDNFTDITLQQRVSVFNKWSFTRPENRIANLAARYLYEDRWGGEMNWQPDFRGGDSIYGESVYTKRLEVIGAYELNLPEKISLAVFVQQPPAKFSLWQYILPGQPAYCVCAIALAKNFQSPRSAGWLAFPVYFLRR